MTLRRIRAALRYVRYIRGLAVPGRAFSSRALTDAAADLPSCQLPETQVAEGSTVVFVRGDPLRLAKVHVRRGGQITWLNCGTTTTMNTTGIFTYRSEPRPFMTGSVVVE